MGQFQTIIDCFNKIEITTLFTTLDLGARLKGKDIVMGNVHNFVNTVFMMEIVCRDKIEKPKDHGGARFLYMKERSLTNDEITKLTTRPQCFDFLKQIKADFKKRQAEPKKSDITNLKDKGDHMLDKRKAKRELFIYLQGRGRIATTENETITSPERIFRSIQAEVINLLNISTIPLSTSQMGNYLGMSNEIITKTISKMMPSETARKYIKKRKKGRCSYYTCDLPHDIEVSSLYSIIRSDLKSIPQPDKSDKPRPILKRMADLLNTYLPNSKFIIDEFIKSFADANKGEKAAKGTAAVFLGRAVKHGYIISELIPKSGRTGPNVEYVKILNIPEKEMTNVTRHITDKSVDLRKKRKEEPIVTQFIDDKVKINVSLKLVKDMENLIKKQHKRVTELRLKLAEMFDENSTLATQNRILNERVTHHQEDFDIDLSKYQDNLQQ